MLPLLIGNRSIMFGLLDLLGLLTLLLRHLTKIATRCLLLFKKKKQLGLKMLVSVLVLKVVLICPRYLRKLHNLPRIKQRSVCYNIIRQRALSLVSIIQMRWDSAPDVFQIKSQPESLWVLHTRSESCLDGV